MAFRDENEALRARIRALQSENERLEDEKSEAEERLAEELEKEDTPAKPVQTPDPNEASTNDERVQAFMRGEGGEDVDSIFGVLKGAGARSVKRSAKERVTCTKLADREIVYVRKETLRESLKSAMWIVPAVGLGALWGAIDLDLALPWAIAFTVATLLFTIALVFSPPKWRLELHGTWKFELFKNNREMPVLEGPMDHLNVHIVGTGKGRYHAEIGLRGKRRLTINRISRSDGYRLRDALERAGKKHTM